MARSRRAEPPPAGTAARTAHASCPIAGSWHRRAHWWRCGRWSRSRLIPPNKAEAILAIPCATSSMFERCLRPVMLSATLADNRLSTPPSKVKDRATGRSRTISSAETGGSAGAGRPCGSSPKRLPIVSTGRCSSLAITDATITASSIPGQLGLNRRCRKISAAEPIPRDKAAGLRVPRAAASAEAWAAATRARRLTASTRQDLSTGWPG